MHLKKISVAIGVVVLLSVVACAAYFSSSFQDENYPSIFRTNKQTSSGVRGSYYNTTVPVFGYLNLLDQSAPSTANLNTGNLYLYGELDSGAVKLSWSAKDVSGNITTGNVLGLQAEEALTTLNVTDIDVDGTAFLDALQLDIPTASAAAATADVAVTINVNGSSYHLLLRSL